MFLNHDGVDFLRSPGTELFLAEYNVFESFSDVCSLMRCSKEINSGLNEILSSH